MKTQKLASAAVAVALGMTVLASGAHAQEKDMSKMMMEKKDAPAVEKCYGVVKAGKNDCASKGNSCAGHSKADNEASAWVSVPTGLCDKLVNGSTTEPVETKK